MNKLFIIGLPRTGTTSISVALLDYGYKVAHTAYTKCAFELADVISDAPCFSEYKQLDLLFPNSKFVYLDRELENWALSMQMLLTKMLPELNPKTGYLNPVLKHSFNKIFSLSTTTDPLRKEHLWHCYLNHKKQVFEYFSNRDDFLNINVNQPGSFKILLDYLGVHAIEVNNFPHLNAGKQVDYWRQLKHTNKINSLSAGKEHRKYFDYLKLP